MRTLKQLLGMCIMLISLQALGASYQDENGLVVIDAESLTGATSNWVKETTLTPYAGTSYIRWNGSDNFSTPAIGVISTSIRINNPGVYRVQMRNKVGHGTNTTESNDTWMKFPGLTAFYGEKNGHKVYPKGSGLTPNPEGASKDGWLKIYCHGTVEWTWRAKTNDNDPYEVFVDFPSAGEYNFSLSGRSKNHCIDRIVMFKSTVTAAYATDLARAETLVESSPNAVSRIAVLADGNSPDPDDLGGTALSLAIIRAMGAEDRLVYYAHSCDLVRNNTKISAVQEVQRQTMMQTACDGTADKWGGFSHITFYNCRTQQNLATSKLTDAINASSAISPLAIVEAGEPDVIYDAIAAAQSDKLQYVSIITHHPANDDSADDPNKNLSNILADFPAVSEDRITDQNVNLKVEIAQWDWARDHSDERIQWLYAQGKLAEQDPVVNFQHGYFDCSDAGMVYYHLTGEKLPTVAMLKTLLVDYVGDGASVDPQPTDSVNIERLKENLLLYYPLDDNANDLSGKTHHATLGEAVTFASGKVGQAASFSAVQGSYLSTPDSLFMYGYETAYTFSFWLKMSSISEREDILQPMGGRTLLYSVGDYSFSSFHQRRKVSFSLSPDEAAEWVHVSIVMDQRSGQTMHKFYINGEQRGDAPSDYALETDRTLTADRVVFGSSSDELLQRNMTGLIDEIYMFNEVLNDAEIAYLAEAKSLNIEGETALASAASSTIKAYVSARQLHIRVPEAKSNSVRVYAMTGALKAQYDFEEQNFKQALDLESGLYILQIRSGNILENKKVVIN